MSSADDKKWVWLFLKIGGGILVLWGVSAFIIVYTIDASDRRAEFGDMFGAVNALFSGFAFAAFIVTLWMQRQEIESAHNASKANNFFGIFSMLFKSLGESISDESHEALGSVKVGSEYNFVLEIKSALELDSGKKNGGSQLATLRAKCVPKFSSSLRTLQALLDLIAESTLTQKEKQDFANYVNSMFSWQELLIVALAGTSNALLCKSINNVAFLRGLPADVQMHLVTKGYYEQTAFA